MTSNKRLCLRRDSFSERICDDLSEVILQYLSLEDKLRLECVSKQFQRTIFQRHYVIKVFDKFNYNFDDFGDKEKYEEYYNNKLKLRKNNGFDWKSFETLLKKCPNIRYISLPKSCNKTVRLITRYCRHLVYFNHPMSHISVTAFKPFHRKFKTTLKYFRRMDLIQELKRLNKFPNTEELVLNCFECNLDIIQTLSFPKLKKLSITEKMTEENQHFFEQLIKNFKCIKHLELKFSFMNDISVNKILTEVSKLKQLIHLSVDTYYGLNNNIFSKTFKQIANNCPNLKSIKVLIDINQKLSSNITQLTFLKSFKNLQRLDLLLKTEASVSRKNSNRLIFSFEAFNGLSNLTHLTLGLSYDSKYDLYFNKNIDMTDIGLILPKLQYLDIHRIHFKLTSLFPIDTEYNYLSQMTDIVSGLSKLETIKLPYSIFDDYEFSDQFEETLFEKCPKLRSIVFL